MKHLKFPQRFAIEGLDPLTLKVKVVFLKEVKIYDNIAEANKEVDLDDFTTPMADKHEGQWCVRYETPEVYKRLSA